MVGGGRQEGGAPGFPARHPVCLTRCAPSTPPPPLNNGSCGGVNNDMADTGNGMRGAGLVEVRCSHTSHCAAESHPLTWGTVATLVTSDIVVDM